MDFVFVALGLLAAFFLAKRDGERNIELNSTIDRLHRSMNAAKARKTLDSQPQPAPMMQPHDDVDFKKNVGDQIAELRAEARAAATGSPLPTPAPTPAGGERRRRPPVRRKVQRNRD